MEKRILVVDDDMINLKMIDFILSQKGYLVDKAASGMECLAKLEEQNYEYDLILLDVEMPEMNGVETLDKIREAEKGKQLKVCFLSAGNAQEIQEDANRLAVAYYINKPILPPELWDIVEKVLM
ncbi:MAG: response regulator [Lachnospiraceae bacterium]|nr:response regulator [Lachnospiraceae bacterium]